MSVSLEFSIAIDQMAAATAVIDDDSMSFTCRMWHIFLGEILLPRDVFQSIYAEIVIGHDVIRPWYDQDGIYALSLNVWGPALARYTVKTYSPADQIFIDYGTTYAVTGFDFIRMNIYDIFV